jgi:hypothetical protein
MVRTMLKMPVRQTEGLIASVLTLMDAVVSCVDGPSDARGKMSSLTGRIDCDHVSGLLTRHHVRWPRWGPRSSPKQNSGFERR